MGTALAAEEEDVPDAGVEEDDEDLGLDQEVSPLYKEMLKSVYTVIQIEGASGLRD